MEFLFSEENCWKICNFEQKMLSDCKNIADIYLPFFNLYGCTLKLDLRWANPIHKIRLSNRPPLENGYEGYVYCMVLKNGKEVRIKSLDGEADYYPLTATWMISSVYRRFSKLEVSLYSDIHEVELDLKDFLLQLATCTEI